MLAPALTERNWSVLGLLRFFLAASVVNYHLFAATGKYVPTYLAGGFTAVAGFFLISGFSINASITASPQHFYRRRLRRLYPLTLTAIILTVAMIAAFGPWTMASQNLAALPSPGDIFATILLLNGIVTITPYIFLPLWSLNCEAVYYFLGPGLKRLPTIYIVLAMALSLLVFSATINPLHHRDYAYTRFGIAALSLMWIWLLGFLIYRHQRHWLINLIAIIACFLVFLHPAVSSHVMGAARVLATGIVLCFLPWITLPAAWVKPANYLRELSFPLYVLHFPVILFAGFIMPQASPGVATMAIWVFTIMISVAAYHGIDRRFRAPRLVKTGQQLS